MIDSQGYRPNVGMILCNAEGQVLVARRSGMKAWQFPQGGIQRNESPLQAMYRELHEELGLDEDDVEVIGYTQGWMRYRLPKKFLRLNCKPLCIGQKQIWFLLRLRCDETSFCLNGCENPEFDCWRWVDYWRPVKDVIFFKRGVYRRALKELEPLLDKF